MMLFSDREDAGRQLAEELAKQKWDENTLVLGLARGGVVVAAQVALALHLPLNVVVPRKVSAPQNPELAIGAMMEDGQSYFDESMIEYTGASLAYIKEAVEKEKHEALRRIALYRGADTFDVRNKVVILVDDGIATGATMLAVIRSMVASKASKVVVAVPVGSAEAIHLVRQEADEVVCLAIPSHFGAVGYFYQVFDQTSDHEVISLLGKVS